ncbi:MAG TPA: hypothetical protein VMM36_16895 [Opitutaceae bacterium]|nr:hypothetical protein [Opitutaceae bacterium]
MALEQNDQPAGGRPPQAGLVIGVIAIGAIAMAVLILTLLRNVPIVVRTFLIAADLLISALACWAIARSAKRG